jgi:hypothetical protein
MIRLNGQQWSALWSNIIIDFSDVKDETYVNDPTYVNEKDINYICFCFRLCI